MGCALRCMCAALARHTQELMIRMARLCGLRSTQQKRSKDKACVVVQRPLGVGPPSRAVLKQVRVWATVPCV